MAWDRASAIFLTPSLENNALLHAFMVSTDLQSLSAMSFMVYSCAGLMQVTRFFPQLGKNNSLTGKK